MKTLSELQEDRRLAGLAYEDAAYRLSAAHIELTAHDMTLSNGNVTRQHNTRPTAQFISGGSMFIPQHPDFLNDTGSFAPQVLAAAATERHIEILADLSAD